MIWKNKTIQLWHYNACKHFVLFLKMWLTNLRLKSLCSKWVPPMYFAKPNTSSLTGSDYKFNWIKLNLVYHRHRIVDAWLVYVWDECIYVNRSLRSMCTTAKINVCDLRARARLPCSFSLRKVRILMLYDRSYKL